MTGPGFQFETGPQEGTNRSAAVTDCTICGGDRFVPVEREHLATTHGEGGYTEAMMACPSCNPVTRAPISEERRWEP